MYITAGQWKRLLGAFLIVLALTTISLAMPIAAAVPEDGEYTIKYEVLRGDPRDDSTSIADGYWNKPATVLVKNGVISIRTVINKDAWVIEFATKKGNRFVDSKVISRDSDKNSRLVEFQVESFDDLVTSMTVDIPEQNYLHSYEARFRFYPDTLTLVKSATPSATDKGSVSQQEEAKPAAEEEKPGSGSDAEAAGTAKPSSKPDATSHANNTDNTEQPESTKAPSKTTASDQTEGSTPSSTDASNQQQSAGSGSSGKDAALGGTQDEESTGTQLDAASSSEGGSDTDSSSSLVDDSTDSSTEQTVDGEINPDASDDVLRQETDQETDETVLDGVTDSLQAESTQTAMGTVEQEQESTPKTARIVIIFVAILIAGLIVWQVIDRKKRKQSS